MGKPVRAYKVENLNKVNTSKYVEGDLFFTSKIVGMLVDGKIKTFTTSTPNLKNYVKKDDVQKMIYVALKKVNEGE